VCLVGTAAEYSQLSTAAVADGVTDSVHAHVAVRMAAVIAACQCRTSAIVRIAAVSHAAATTMPRFMCWHRSYSRCCMRVLRAGAWTTCSADAAASCNNTPPPVLCFRSVLAAPVLCFRSVSGLFWQLPSSDSDLFQVCFGSFRVIFYWLLCGSTCCDCLARRGMCLLL
jgi:hypothetical protein